MTTADIKLSSGHDFFRLAAWFTKGSPSSNAVANAKVPNDTLWMLWLFFAAVLRWSKACERLFRCCLICLGILLSVYEYKTSSSWPKRNAKEISRCAKKLYSIPPAFMTWVGICIFVELASSPGSNLSLQVCINNILHSGDPCVFKRRLKNVTSVGIRRDSDQSEDLDEVSSAYLRECATRIRVKISSSGASC